MRGTPRSRAASKRRRVPCEVAAEEVVGRVPFPAPVAAGDVGEGGVDEDVVAREVGRGAVEVEGCEGGGRVQGGAAAEGGDVVAVGEEVGDRVVADEARGAGDGDPHRGGGRVSGAGTGPSPA